MSTAAHEYKHSFQRLAVLAYFNEVLARFYEVYQMAHPVPKVLAYVRLRSAL
jgi:hypothetical protein